MERLVQKKLLFTILVSLLVFNAIVLGGSRMILLDSFLQLEQAAVEENLYRLASAVQNDSETLGILCRDWSFWDDTYRFVQDKNQGYMDSNLGDDSLLELSLNALLIFDSRGELVFGKGMDLESEEAGVPPQVLLDYFQQREDLWPPQNSFSRQDGLLLFEQGPMMLSFRPILTSDNNGPAMGIMVMARWFSDAVRARLAERMALELELKPLTNSLQEQEEVVQIQPLKGSEKQIRGDVLIHDLEGHPAFHLSISMPRSLFYQGQRTVIYFQLSFFVFSFLFGAVLYLLLSALQKKRSVAEKRFRYIFENATDGLFVVENDEHLALINPAAQKLLGVGDDLARAGRACFAIPEFKELISAGLNGKIAGPVEISLPDPKRSGQSHLRAYMAPLVGEQGKQHGAIATLQDMTREKELQRMKDEFIASAAHELNTPLSIIIGFTDLLESGEYNGCEELLEYCGLINEKAHSLEKIVDDLLHLGKIEAGREIYLDAEPYDLAEHIHQVVETYEKKSPKHSFQVNLMEDDVVVVADRHRLGQVFDNLLSNAVKYSPNGGLIKVSGSRHEHELLICVADEGVGLTEEQVGRVFEKFYRVDNSLTAVRGLGLGLNISRSIIEAHGGRIWLRSTPGEGTRFYFTLPDGLQ
ncbi:PAS domain S-box-containing protein [Malonomonas rubra DSM 5091]|uniref:histidine kinase n=1 Tax=Malonomonas rubra DSM 5091 TaxID=1122189 RepID=A0A1M6I1J1_MALRU|nr:CHASE4 domain-containing protein [Malonomonas rubra]SHJ28250.1 PAS domain S-box-containing protein [Malonomonas rubra DSM 5091]